MRHPLLPPPLYKLLHKGCVSVVPPPSLLRSPFYWDMAAYSMLLERVLRQSARAENAYCRIADQPTLPHASTERQFGGDVGSGPQSPTARSPPRHTARATRCQHQAHSSVQKAANIAGLGTNVRMIATHGGGETAEGNAYALDVVDLATAMREDIAAGLTPVFVNANVGSTNSCAVDPVLAMGDICQRWKVATFKNRGEWEGVY